MAIALHGGLTFSHVRRGLLGLGAVGAGMAIAAGLSARPGELARADAAGMARARVTTQVATELRADFASAFAERDANRDGRVTPHEAPYLRPATFRRLDGNGDGAVTLAESMPAPAEVAGTASRAEATFRAAFGQLDANQDGWLQAAEAPGFMGLGEAPIGYEGFLQQLQAKSVAPVAAASGTSKQPPVLMLPGFLMPARSFGLMRETLVSAGYRDFKVLDRWPWFTDIEEFAAEGKWLADRMRERTGAGQIVLLGHSMGGLVGRTMIHQLGYEGHVRDYVSFGTPHHGTVLGPLAHWYANSSVQMTPGSAYLRALNRFEGRPSPVRFTSVHAQLDEIVYPHSSVDLRGAANPEVPLVFHTTMIMMPAVCQATLDALAD